MLVKLNWFKALLIIVICFMSVAFVPKNKCQDYPGFLFRTNRSVEVQVELICKSGSIPVYYSAKLRSPVCMEDICKPIDVIVIWDLLGNFIEYVENSEDPLTKFDHKPFTKEDHLKLKSILSNKGSLLQDYRLEDLVDTMELVYSEEIDGMTGATNKTFEDDIVSGAIYTCYMLWNFVNGDISHEIFKYTDSILGEELGLKMLESINPAYVKYVLSHMNEMPTNAIKDKASALILEREPLIAIQAINSLPRDFWATGSGIEIFSEFNTLEIPIRNALIRSFENCSLDEVVIMEVIGLLPIMTPHQKKACYNLFEYNKLKFEGCENCRAKLHFIMKEMSLSSDEYEILSILGIEI